LTPPQAGSTLARLGPDDVSSKHFWRRVRRYLVAVRAHGGFGGGSCSTPARGSPMRRA
jgi:hypothetical protein